jgi:hypothetical protein
MEDETMSRFTASGGVRPSRAMSLMAAAVGLGILLTVASFFIGGPVLGIGLFVLVWIFAVVGIIGYHLWNAFSPGGADHTQFHFRAEHDPAPPGGPKTRP